jgi:hypothetical protein
MLCNPSFADSKAQACGLGVFVLGVAQPTTTTTTTTT